MTDLIAIAAGVVFVFAYLALARRYGRRQPPQYGRALTLAQRRRRAECQMAEWRWN
jgi:hypothetical protein